MDKIKEQFRDTFPSIVADTKAFLKENADQKVGEISLGQLYGGMRGMPALICETSKLIQRKGFVSAATVFLNFKKSSLSILEVSSHCLKDFFT